MYNYTIDKDVPFTWTLTRNQSKYPYPDMQIGDSFFVPCNKQNSRVSATSSQYWKNNKCKFATRQIKENWILVWYRCWRIE